MENSRITQIFGINIYPHKNLNKAIKLGIEGILTESTHIKSKDPYESLNGIVNGLCRRHEF